MQRVHEKRSLTAWHFFEHFSFLFFSIFFFSFFAGEGIAAQDGHEHPSLQSEHNPRLELEVWSVLTSENQRNQRVMSQIAKTPVPSRMWGQRHVRTELWRKCLVA